MAEERSASVRGTNGLLRRRRAWVVCLALLVVGWLVWSLTKSALAVPNRLYVVPSGSMSPTIRAGDRVAVQAYSNARPKRGEIWVFRMPPSSRQAPNIALKRVIGLPGERVEVANGQVLIGGQPLSEPYLAAPTSYSMPPLTLGPDEYFVLGDSRNSSHDSHVWGPLPADHLIGPVKARVWPMQRIGGF
jgi:signal peptidase I